MNFKGCVRDPRFLGDEVEKVILAWGVTEQMGWQERAWDIQRMASSPINWNICCDVEWMGLYCLLSSWSQETLSRRIVGHVLSAQLVSRPSWSHPGCAWQGTDITFSVESLSLIGLIKKSLLNHVMSSFYRV